MADGRLRRALPALAILASALLVARGPARGGATVAARSARPMAAGPLAYAHAATWDVPGALVEPLDVALAIDGRLFVADGRRNTVRQYDAAGSLRTSWQRDAAVAFCDPLVPFAIAVDEARGIAFAGWHCYEDGHLSTSAFYLDPRPLDGGATPSLVRVRVVSATDFDVDPATGDLIVAGARGLYRVTPSDGTVQGEIDLGPLGGAVTRVAVRGDTVAFLRAARAYVARVTLAGEALEPLVIEGQRAVALGAESQGRLAVITQPLPGPRGSPPTDGPFLHVYDASDTEVAAYTGADLQAPEPPPTDWRWSISVQGDELAFTTMAERFEVRRALVTGEPRGWLRGGPARATFAPYSWKPRTGVEAFSVTAAPDGGVVVLDDVDGEIVRFDRSGGAMEVLAAPTGAVDMAVDDQGRVYVSTADDRVRRLPGPGDEAGWEAPCDCGLGGRIAVAPHALYVSRPRPRWVGVLDPDSGAPVANMALPDSVGLWPADVAASPAGALAADVPAHRVHVWQGGEVDDWLAGLTGGPRNVSYGGPAEAPVAVVSTTDGWLEVHEPLSGTLRARWRPTLPDGAQPFPWDVAVGTEGSLYVADPALRAVHVFVPRPGTPEPVPTATALATPTPGPGSCDVTAAKEVRPPMLTLGAEATVSMTLAMGCPGGVAVGYDVVLAIDTSASMEGPNLAAAKGAAEAFAERLDVRHHRVGLVAFSDDATIAAPVTDDVAAVVQGIRALHAAGSTNLAAAIDRADENLRLHGRANALGVIILLSDGSNAGGVRSVDDAARDAATRGVLIVAIGLSNSDRQLLQRIVGGPEWYFRAGSPEALPEIYARLVDLLTLAVPGDIVVREHPGAEAGLEAQSAAPPALEGTGALEWALVAPPDGPATFTYKVRPSVVGDVHLAAESFAEYTDGDGARRSVTFPDVVVRVLPTGPQIRTPTPRPRPARLFLPLAFDRSCLDGRPGRDVIVLLDVSRSMTEATASGTTKLAAATTALADFAASLPRGDRLALVTFGDAVRLAAPLGRARAPFLAALQRVAPEDRSSLAAGILRASGLAPRPADATLVLVTDGRVAPDDPATAIAVAGEARARGLDIVAVGVGAAVDAVTLRALASSDQFYWAEDLPELLVVFTDLAVPVPCGGSLPLLGYRPSQTVGPRPDAR